MWGLILIPVTCMLRSISIRTFFKHAPQKLLLITFTAACVFRQDERMLEFARVDWESGFYTLSSKPTFLLRRVAGQKLLKASYKLQCLQLRLYSSFCAFPDSANIRSSFMTEKLWFRQKCRFQRWIADLVAEGLDMHYHNCS